MSSAGADRQGKNADARIFKFETKTALGRQTGGGNRMEGGGMHTIAGLEVDSVARDGELGMGDGRPGKFLRHIKSDVDVECLGGRCGWKRCKG